MLSIVKSFGLNGINGYDVNIEVDINKGMPKIETVGLPDAAVKESKERVRSAIKNSGFLFFVKQITINLSPADTKKEGTFYDLPIAIGMLSATEQVNYKQSQNIAFIGELSLDGKLRRVNGILPMLIHAAQSGYKQVVIPSENAQEATVVDGISTYALKSLSETAQFLANPELFQPVGYKDILSNKNSNTYSEDFKFVKGQAFAKRAMEIAAAGGHNILLIGPPGGGKTMLAKCMPSILPDMTASEALETTKIHSVAGKLKNLDGVVVNRPFRTPHHTSSMVSMTGGSSGVKPGEVSLAHNGILFLDEILEYSRSALEVLRQPLEDKYITISRATRSVRYPANFVLVASMNPCPCGNFGSKVKECTCPPAKISKYLSKLSGPLLDRIDLHIEVDGVTYGELTNGEFAEESSKIKERVNRARSVQIERYKDTRLLDSGLKVSNNANMTAELTAKYCVLDEKSEIVLKKAFERLGLSARAYSRILKVARTIADLDGCDSIKFEHLSEAIGYRSLDRNYWH